MKIVIDKIRVFKHPEDSGSLPTKREIQIIAEEVKTCLEENYIDGVGFIDCKVTKY